MYLQARPETCLNDFPVFTVFDIFTLNIQHQKVTKYVKGSNDHLSSLKQFEPANVQLMLSNEDVVVSILNAEMQKAI